MKKLLSLCLLPVVSASSLSAATILFNLRDTGQTTAIESGSYTVDSVLMSLSSDQGSINQSSSAFGVNHSAGSADEADLIDGDEGPETLKFSFDQSGTLDEITMSSFGSSDTFDLRKNGTLVMSLADQGNSEIFSPNETYVPTDIFTITYTGGNGASLDTVTITAVPEPSSALLVSLAGALVFLRRRR